MKIEVSFDTPLVVIHKPAEQPWRAIWTIQSGGWAAKGENMASTMQVNSYATVSVAWKDKSGNPAKVDGPTKWTSSDPATCQCTVSTGNPLIANLFAPGPIGKVQIHADADADLGSGVQPVTSSIDVEVISGEAVGGEITFTQSPAQGGPGTTGATGKPPTPPPARSR